MGAFHHARGTSAPPWRSSRAGLTRGSARYAPRRSLRVSPPSSPTPPHHLEGIPRAPAMGLAQRGRRRDSPAREGRDGRDLAAPLGDATGTKGVGLNRVRVEPGKLPTPPHSHGASEEIYFVLEVSGLAWQDDQRARGGRPATAWFTAPDELGTRSSPGPGGLRPGLRQRHPTELGWLPRSRAVRSAGRGRGPHRRPVGREAESEPLAFGEPGAATGEHRQHRRGRAGAWGGATTAHSTTQGPLTTQAACTGSGSTRATRIGACHSEEEEILVILEGSRNTPLLAAADAPAARREKRRFRFGPATGSPRPPGTRRLALVPGRPELDDDADLHTRNRTTCAGTRACR